jgi:uncharacterized protein YkwD
MKLLTIFLILITNFCISQTSLDSLCLDKINNYRKSNSKSVFTWNNIAYNAANHHSHYLKDSTDVLTHHESVLINPKDRLVFFGGKYSYVAENVLVVSLNFSESDKLSEIQEKISSEVLDTWVNSPSHNKILLSQTQLAGVSSAIQKQGCGIEGFTNYTIWSTLVVYNP